MSEFKSKELFQSKSDIKYLNSDMTKEQYQYKSKLITTFKNCLDILRDNEAFTGEKALRNLTYLITLKLLEDRFKNFVDITKYPYEFDIIDELVEQHKTTLFKYIYFSNLSKENEENFPKNFKFLWNDILSVHPFTSRIFIKDTGFDIKRGSTFKKLIKEINSINDGDIDILGSAYEEVIKDTMTGKAFGQHFTQPIIKNIMVELIDPSIFPDGKIETCGDPSMGTGGFLITYLKYIVDKAKKQNINLDWDFIKNKGLYGREIVTDNYQLAISNMLIQSGYIFENFENDDSIRNPITQKFDNILANPPFGIKGLKYDEIISILRDEYLPIKSDNAVVLFIQCIIYMLKINGKCAVVLPQGKEIFSKTDKSLTAIRELLLKSCDIKEIISLPSGLFEYTNIETCICYFIKKKEMSDVMTISNTDKKQQNRTYKFQKDFQTQKIGFYYFDEKENKKKLLVEVSIENIIKNKYSLNSSDYIEKKSVVFNKDIEIKTLGEVCEIIKGIKQNSKNGKKIGLYPLYYCSILGYLYLDTYTYTGEGIIINKTNGSGKAMIYYGKDKYNVGETTIHFKSKNEHVNTKYIYNYLLHNLSLVEQYFKGANQKSITDEDLFKIEIPIPSLQVQTHIVEYLDFLYQNIETNRKQILELKRLNEWKIQNQEKFGKNEMKTLGEVCEFLPKSKRNAKYGKIEGLYPFFKSSMKVDNYVDEPDYNQESLIIGDGGEPNINYGVKFSTSDHCYILQNKNTEIIKLKYVYYYLYNNLDIMKQLYTGIAIKNISKNNIENIQIPIPSPQVQIQIIEYCQHNDKLIKDLENSIYLNRQLAHQFIKDILESPQEQQDIKPTPTEDDTKVELPPLENPNQPTPNPLEELNTLGITELKRRAKLLGIPKLHTYKTSNKDELIKLMIR